jgi:hypothetical protein
MRDEETKQTRGKELDLNTQLEKQTFGISA